MIMNTQLLERILLGFGALVLIGFAASYFIEDLQPYHNSLRIAAIVGVALYAIYSFLVQSKDQKEIHSAEVEAENFQRLAKKERQRGDELQEANLDLQANLTQAQNEAEALKQRIAELESQQNSKS
jgi:uncharacterized protein HemX